MNRSFLVRNECASETQHCIVCSGKRERHNTKQQQQTYTSIKHRYLFLFHSLLFLSFIKIIYLLFMIVYMLLSAVGCVSATCLWIFVWDLPVCCMIVSVLVYNMNPTSTETKIDLLCVFSSAWSTIPQTRNDAKTNFK